MTATALVVLTVFVATAYLLYRQYPGATQTWFRRLMTARTVISTLLVAATAFFFLTSGVLLMVVIGAAIVALGVLYILVNGVPGGIFGRLAGGWI